MVARKSKSRDQASASIAVSLLLPHHTGVSGNMLVPSLCLVLKSHLCHHGNPTLMTPSNTKPPKALLPC